MRTDVLVVGAGPSGLMLAGELARRGVGVRVIDRREGPDPRPRALGVQARTLEILDLLGLADALVARGAWTTGFAVHEGGRPRAALDHDLGRFGARFEGSLFVHQAETEALLRGRLERLGGRVEWGRELTGAEIRGDGATARLACGATIEAAWIAGCDGARSVVREAAGVGFPGHDDDTWLVAEADAAPELPRDRVHFCRHGDGHVVLFPFGPGRRWHVVDTAPPEDEARIDVEALRADLSARLVGATGAGGALGALANVSRFTIPQRRAAAFRAGRALLLGDAAHVHSPSSGRGMNAGIEDAFALGWRLAAVTRGEADPALTEGYEAERRPAAGRLLAVSWIGTRLIEPHSRPVRPLLGAAIAALGRAGAAERAAARLYTGEMSGLASERGGVRFPRLPSALWDAPEGRALARWLGRPEPKLLGAGRAPPASPGVLSGALGADLPDPEGRLARAAGLPEGLVAALRPDGRLIGVAPANEAGDLLADRLMWRATAAPLAAE